MRRALRVGVVAAMAAACHRQPQPVLEYGETVTYTSTANDPTPQPVAPAPGIPLPSQILEELRADER